MRHLAIASLVLALALGCATNGPSDVEQDPMVDSNRSVFGFNDGFDRILLVPLATGWDFITPDVVARAIDRFFDNLAFPRRFFACLLQAQLIWGGSEFGRFLVNTTIGIVGILPASEWLGMPAHDEDFGQAFGAWGIPSGAYWILPFFGSSNPRDTVGLALDAAFNLAPGVTFPLRLVNTRSLYLDQVEEIKAASLDYYAFVRNAYIARRRAEVANQPIPEDTVGDEDIYDVDQYDE